MKLKYYFILFLTSFALLEAFFVIGAVSFVTLMNSKQHETLTLQDLDRIFSANEMELVGNLMLRHPKLLREQIIALSKRENLRIQLTLPDTSEIQEGKATKNSPTRDYPILYGGTSYGKIRLARSDLELASPYSNWVFIFIGFQMFIFSLVALLIYRWSFRAMILPLELLIINGQLQRNTENNLKLTPLTTGRETRIPKEVTDATEMLSKLWNELKEQSHQAAVGKISTQVAHDIRSPLAALNAISQDLVSLPENTRLIIRSAIRRINDIANHLAQKSVTLPGPKVHLIQSLVEEIVSEKRLQYRARWEIDIEFQPSSLSYGLFAMIQGDDLKRAISNLIDNSIESLLGKGQVLLFLSTDSSKISLQIQDNGIGIPQTILNKLGQRNETYGKKEGTGLGLFHARTSVESWQGSLHVTSQYGQGTTVQLLFPKAQPPSWWVSHLFVFRHSTWVILDDDESIHRIWKIRASSTQFDIHGIQLVHLWTPTELRVYRTENLKSDEKTRYLVDDEILGFKETGLDLIQELGIASQSILVTSRFEEPWIRDRCQKLEVPLIPKGMAAFVPILIH